MFWQYYSNGLDSLEKRRRAMHVFKLTHHLLVFRDVYVTTFLRNSTTIFELPRRAPRDERLGLTTALLIELEACIHMNCTPCMCNTHSPYIPRAFTWKMSTSISAQPCRMLPVTFNRALTQCWSMSLPSTVHSSQWFSVFNTCETEAPSINGLSLSPPRLQPANVQLLLLEWRQLHERQASQLCTCLQV